jgi:uncharacterized protein
VGVAQRKLEVLSPDECLRLLGQASVGRLVYVDDIGPTAVPVNYAMAGADIVIRVEGGTKQQAMSQSILAFEVDHIDEDTRSGWSVVARGPGLELELDRLSSTLDRLQSGFPHPWALGVHNVWLQITPKFLTGRRLGEPGSLPVF